MVQPPVTTSRNGTLFIARREALVLVAYQDGPHCSVGFGTNNPTLSPGDRITVKRAFELLKSGIAAREPGLAKRIHAPVTQQQFDALMSLHYQSGNRYIPKLVQAINAKDYAGAAEMFPDCDRNLAGVQIAGLRKRRLMEQAIFLRGDYGELDPIPFWQGDPRTTKQGKYHLQPGDI